MLTNIIKYSNSNLQLSKLINILQTQSKHNPNYIATNSNEVMSHLHNFIHKQEWKNAFDFAKQVPLSGIGNIKLWNQLSQAINFKLNSKFQSHQKFNIDQFQNVMKFVNVIRYELDSRDQNIYQWIAHAVNNRQIQDVLRLGNYSLLFWPQIYEKRCIQIQKFFTQNPTKISFPQYKNFIQSAMMTNFFSNQFTPLLNSSLSSLISFKKFLQLPNKSISTQIVSSNKSSAKRSATENKIGELLKDLGYIFDENVYINGLEVDFIFQKKVILEYNGVHHYRCNSQGNGNELFELTKYMKWKNRMLENRNFLVLQVNYAQFDKISGQKAQKLFFIDFIEKSILDWIDKNNN